MELPWAYLFTCCLAAECCVSSPSKERSRRLVSYLSFHPFSSSSPHWAYSLSFKVYVMSPTILITGASSGIGKAAAKHFATQGWNVVATMRQPAQEQELTQLPNVLVVELDVQQPATIQTAIAAGIQKFQHLDVLVNNAGYGQNGIFEAVTPAQVQQQFDVNVFGVMNTIRAILPHFRARRAGLIINISSGAGRFTLPLLSLYSASKFALEGFSEALAYELLPLNIGVKIVEPGGTDTGFIRAVEEKFAFDPALTEYADYNAAVGEMYTGLLSAKLTSPQEVAAKIYQAATDPSDTLRYVIGEDIKAMLAARASLPDQEYVSYMRENFNPKL